MNTLLLMVTELSLMNIFIRIGDLPAAPARL